MHKPVLIVLLILLSLFGIADSWYIYQNEHNDTALACDIAGLDGCNVVAQSEYSELNGVPLALYGVIFYAFLFALVLLIWFVPSRTAHELLVALGIGGALASLVFLFIQLALIKAVCIYCIASAVTSFLFCWLSFWLFVRFAPPRLAVVG